MVSNSCATLHYWIDNQVWAKKNLKIKWQMHAYLILLLFDFQKLGSWLYYNYLYHMSEKVI